MKLVWSSHVFYTKVNVQPQKNLLFVTFEYIKFDSNGLITYQNNILIKKKSTFINLWTNRLEIVKAKMYIYVANKQVSPSICIIIQNFSIKPEDEQRKKNDVQPNFMFPISVELIQKIICRLFTLN